MDKIESFKIDHTILVPGMYISRTDGDIVTYDIRMRHPNTEPCMENAPMHTIEHLFATYVRNSEFSGNIVYFGPMGCRTGFYFLTRGMSHGDAVELAKRSFDFIAGFTGEIPGAKESECGNYKDHDLDGAKKEARMMCRVLENAGEDTLSYPVRT